MANGSVVYSVLNSSFHGDDHSLAAYNDGVMRLHLPAIVYTAVMMLVGLPGNMVVFYVYLFKWRRSTSRMFILFLAALDMVNCATTLPMEIFIMRYSLMMDLPFVCKLSRFSTYTMNSASAMILVGIAADRFTRICRPYQRTFSEAKSRHISIFAIVAAICVTWPCLILYGTRRVNFGQIAGTSCLIQNRFDHTIYPIAFFGIMGSLTLAIFTTLAVLYTFVGIQIYKHRNFKLKNCSHVQQVVEEKSTEKSQSVKQVNDSGYKQSKDSETNGVKNNAANGICIQTTNVSDVKNEEQPGISHLLTAYHLQLPEPSHDAGTSCGQLNIPNHSFQDVSSDRNFGDFSTKDVDIDEASRIELDETVKQTATENVPNVALPAVVKSPPRRPNSKRHRRARVRYLLVRGSSTLTASGGTKCVNCLTIRIGRSTLMLFLITLAYVISFLPFYTMAILRQSNASFVQGLSSAWYMAYHVFLRSYLLSSAINPIIYSFCNVQFREYCIDMFWRLFQRNNEHCRLKGRVRGNLR